MKYEELKSFNCVDSDLREFCEPRLVYSKSDVDAAIAELKAEINRKEAVGKRWFEQCMEARAENVRLKRALYKACSNWARSERYTEATWHGDEHREELWAKVEVKCLKKAEEAKFRCLLR